MVSRDQEAADFFLALANENRHKILQLLRTEPAVPVSRIAELTQTSPNRISDHLAMLRREGILLANKQGREVRYRAVPDRVEQYCARFLLQLGISITDASEPKQSLPAHTEYKRLRVFASFGRCAVLRLVSKQDLTIKEIQSQVFMEQQTVSDHVRLLRKAKLIECRKEGRFVKCSLNKENVARIFHRFLQSLVIR